jgi:hypothetical protein
MTHNDDSGMALVSTMMIMVLMSGLLVGFFALIAADQMASGVNRDQTQAYAAAHAGLEKLTADLGSLFVGGNYSPSATQIAALTAAPPSIPGFQFLAPDGTSGYTITQQAVVTDTIPSGPYQGLTGLLTPYQITVTAQASANLLGVPAEVRLRRTLQTVAVPVFQFGIYSDGDLSFFAGANFNFGGRVHTNQNLYLAQDEGSTLSISDVVTAAGEVVRTYMSNGLSLSTAGHTGVTNIATTAGSNPVYRALSCGSQGGSCGGSVQEGSVNVATVPPSTLQTVNGTPTMVLVPGNTPNEPTWTSVTTGPYNGRIKNERTGATRLDLPLVSDGLMPIEIIRRPPLTIQDPQDVLTQRYFYTASVRILLSDRQSDLTGLPTVTGTPPVSLPQLALSAAYRANPNGMGAVTWVNNIPLAEAGTAANGYQVPQGTPIADGYLKIERQNTSGIWSDVTVEILNLGFTGKNLANNATWNTAGTTCASDTDPNPSAVIRLQRVRDNPSNNTATLHCGHTAAGVWSTTASDYLPNILYDAREGARRDDPTGMGTNPYFAGVMYYIELDVKNLKAWLATHTDTANTTGFVVYFSDRRGNKNLGASGVATPREGADGILYTADDFGTDNQETGELGFEDIVNPLSSESVSNGILDSGEDVNGNGILDVYGGIPRLYPTSAAPYANAGVLPVPTTGATGAWAYGANTGLMTPITSTYQARSNPAIFFRRALKLVNGGYTGTVNLPANGTQGLTVAAENPVYVQGNYNAPNAAGTGFGTTPGTDHVSAAVIGDAVTLLSNSFNDIESFMSPHAVANDRAASTTWYRMAVISGKGLSFPHPTSNPSNDNEDFGTDGGVLRYIENWGGDTLDYLGSIVSFYTNRQAVGIYKCCDVVYSPPTRAYSFDTDFLTPSLLPPKTPMFRAVNVLTFLELLRPTQ